MLTMLGFARRLVKQAEGIIAPEPSTHPEYGFRVLYTEAGSEAVAAGLEPLFDYIVGVNGETFEPPKTQNPIDVEPTHVPLEKLDQLIRSSSLAQLEVWSMKGSETRTVNVRIAPSAEDYGLGAVVQWTPIEAAEHVWHILDTTPHSPADHAGLISHSDYIVGAERGLLEQGGENLLARVVTHVAGASDDGGITLYVYNHDYDTLRPVRIVPRRDERTGALLLGCGVGYGLLHRLPARSKKMPPGHTLFDEGEPLHNSPLDSAAAPPMPAATPNIEAAGNGDTIAQPPSHRHHKSAQKHQSQDLDSYFAEQSALSREIDRPSSKPKSNVLPPPSHPKEDQQSHPDTTHDEAQEDEAPKEQEKVETK